MSDTYQFMTDLAVDGKKYRAGETVGKSDLPYGSFLSMKRQRQIVEFKEVPPDVAPPVEIVLPVAPPEPQHHHHKTKRSK